MLTYDEFYQGMKILERAVPTFKPVLKKGNEPGTYDVFYELLKDLEPDVFKAAVLKVSSDVEFVSLRAIREAANAITSPTLKTGLEAWEEVLDQVRGVGSYGFPHFEDPLTARLVNSLGWHNICLSEEPMIERAHFIKAYESAAKREHDEARQLPCVQEIQAAQRGRIGEAIGKVIKKLAGRNGKKEQA